MTLLATIVHVSDLHIGVPDPRTGNGSTTADLRVLASTFSTFHGSLGHQARSLRELQSFVTRLAKSGEPFELLVTGDFTRCGEHRELQLAYDYLVSDVQLRPGTPPAGLRLGALPERVAGNHDHWGGYNLPTSIAPSVFPTSTLQPATGFPYITPKGAVGSRPVVFIGVDSDSDVPPGSLRRMLARGHFLSQLQKLGQQLGPNTADEIRILVIHHARHEQGFKLRMSLASRTALDAFCAVKGIRVVLSGHTHKPHAGGVSGVLEVCSPSTTQIDKAPPGWVNWRGGRPSVHFEQNGLIVHRLHDDGGAIRWDAHVMTRDPGGLGFLESSVQKFLI